MREPKIPKLNWNCDKFVKCLPVMHFWVEIFDFQFSSVIFANYYLSLYPLGTFFSPFFIKDIGNTKKKHSMNGNVFVFQSHLSEKKTCLVYDWHICFYLNKDF